MSETIGILGTGIVGVTLGNGLKQAGYEVRLGNRSAHPVDNWNGSVGTYQETVDHSDLIILCVKGSVAEQVIQDLADQLGGKTVVDATNPIDSKPPDDGVLHYFTSLDESLMERLQNIAPKANFVKAFNSVGNAHMINPDFGNNKPIMFICGNDDRAKKATGQLLEKIGWSYEDFGGVKSARAIEPLCILWCIPGMLRGEWSHAFTLLRSEQK